MVYNMRQNTLKIQQRLQYRFNLQKSLLHTVNSAKLAPPSTTIKNPHQYIFQLCLTITKITIVLTGSIVQLIATHINNNHIDEPPLGIMRPSGVGIGSGQTHVGLRGCHREVCFDRAFLLLSKRYGGPRSMTDSALLTLLASGSVLLLRLLGGELAVLPENFFEKSHFFPHRKN